MTSLLAGSVTSTAVETVAMNDKKNDSGPGAPRLYRQRGKSKVWTCLVKHAGGAARHPDDGQREGR